MNQSPVWVRGSNTSGSSILNYDLGLIFYIFYKFLIYLLLFYFIYSVIFFSFWHTRSIFLLLYYMLVSHMYIYETSYFQKDKFLERIATHHKFFIKPRNDHTAFKVNWSVYIKNRKYQFCSQYAIILGWKTWWSTSNQLSCEILNC